MDIGTIGTIGLRIAALGIAVWLTNVKNLPCFVGYFFVDPPPPTFAPIL